jgi:LPS export ABC transporter protein LptC
MVICLIAILLGGCENDPPAIDLDQKKTSIEVAKNVATNYTQGGKLKAHLTAPLMLRVQDTLPYVEFPNTLHVDFYNGDTIIESRLDARYAKYTEARAIVFLRDSVKLISTNGDTLLCPQLYWDRSKVGKEFYTTMPVIVKTRTQIIYGQKGMEISQDLKTKSFYEITNSVFRVPSSQFPE